MQVSVQAPAKTNGANENGVTASTVVTLDLPSNTNDVEVKTRKPRADKGQPRQPRKTAMRTGTGSEVSQANNVQSAYHGVVLALTEEKQKHETEIHRINKALEILGYVG